MMATERLTRRRYHTPRAGNRRLRRRCEMPARAGRLRHRGHAPAHEPTVRPADIGRIRTKLLRPNSEGVVSDTSLLTHTLCGIPSAMRALRILPFLVAPAFVGCDCQPRVFEIAPQIYLDACKSPDK